MVERRTVIKGAGAVVGAGLIASAVDSCGHGQRPPLPSLAISFTPRSTI